MWVNLESQAHRHTGFQMELWALEVSRDTKGRRERRVTVVCLDLQDCLGGQDLWVQKVSPSWVLQDLLVLQVNLELMGLEDPALEGPQALLDPQDQYLHMDQLSVSLDLLVLQAHQDLQDMQTR